MLYLENRDQYQDSKCKNLLFDVICSFGYCEKEEVKGHKPVGQYGNGFKSGSMRIGRDALVFTKAENTMSVGMLSQTYLEAIEAETVLVPIITWQRNTNIL